MQLLTQAQRQRLLANGRQSRSNDAFDPHPVVKLFTPDAQCTWLLSELDPDDPDIAFALCDLGAGCPELGNVSVAELSQVRGRLGLAIERDRSFIASQPLSAYAEAARRAGRITC